MFHANLIKMIEYARSFGDILIVGMNTDELTVLYKSKPIIPFDECITLVKVLKCFDVAIPEHSFDHVDKMKN